MLRSFKESRLENFLRISSLTSFSVCFQDAPAECAESQWILKTETVPTLSSLVKVIKEPWEKQFGVELQKNLYPSITVRLRRNNVEIIVLFCWLNIRGILADVIVYILKIESHPINKQRLELEREYNI